MTPTLTTIRLWWHTIDRLLLVPLLIIIMLGIWLVFAASPAVAVRINLDKFYFLVRHITMLAPALLVMLLLSMQNTRTLKILCLTGFFIMFGLTVATLFMGIEVKGATRWLSFPGGSVQPSEFLKPLFAVLIAWIFAKQQEMPRFPSQTLAIAALLICIAVLALQPDMGMSVVLFASWLGQYILAGLPWIYVGAVSALGVVGAGAALMFSSHVQARVEKFLNPTGTDTYQIQKALDAFANGGWLGTGPAEGTVKMTIPDAHADFVFAVAGEELGLVTCTLIVLLFAWVVLRGFQRAGQQRDMFAVLAVGGIMMQFGLQTLVNLASSLHLIPTKGMTLPFVSYGGSSLIALAIGMGVVLALTRQQQPTVNVRRRTR